MHESPYILILHLKEDELSKRSLVEHLLRSSPREARIEDLGFGCGALKGSLNFLELECCIMVLGICPRLFFWIL